LKCNQAVAKQNAAGQKITSRIQFKYEPESTAATHLLLSGYAMPMKRRRLLKAILIIGVVVTLLSIYYVRTHPLVFNESLWQHAHCMPQAASSFRMYAADHGGVFPCHTNGYGDALLMMTPERAWFYFLTGPGYDTSALKEALDSGGDVDESRCGRVYVQGLSETNDARIALFFDKVAAPPDHSHFPRRLWRGFVREVCFVDGHWDTVPVERWSAFAQEQIELLVQAGFTRERAEGLYSQAR
jgi:hypothetical protein